MHPWNGVSFSERKKRHAEMREWLIANPQKRIAHGTKREDGKIFCGYSVGYSNGEYWAKRDTFEKRLNFAREQMRKLRKDPTYRLEYAEYCRDRYANRSDVRKNNAKRGREWAATFPEKINQRASKRRALKRSLWHPQHDERIEAELHAEAKRLTKKTGKNHHVDHIIPIKFGGWHHHLNLQVLPCDINQSKNSNPFWISESYKDFRSVPQELWPESLVDLYLAIRTI